MLAAHGVAGFTGILFIGVFAQASWNGVADGALYGDLAQLGEQALAAIAAPVYAFGATFVLLKLIGLVMPLRATAADEAIGMDIVSHGEEAYATGEGAILVVPDGIPPEPACRSASGSWSSLTRGSRARPQVGEHGQHAAVPLAARREPQLVEDRRDVALDRALGQVHGLGDRAVAAALRPSAPGPRARAR